eukprot:scaffold14365_cov101-Isochrysis_galbana.AAC.1
MASGDACRRKVWPRGRSAGEAARAACAAGSRASSTIVGAVRCIRRESRGDLAPFLTRGSDARGCGDAEVSSATVPNLVHDVFLCRAPAPKIRHAAAPRRRARPVHGGAQGPAAATVGLLRQVAIGPRVSRLRDQGGQRARGASRRARLLQRQAPPPRGIQDAATPCPCSAAPQAAVIEVLTITLWIPGHCSAGPTGLWNKKTSGARFVPIPPAPAPPRPAVRCRGPPAGRPVTGAAPPCAGLQGHLPKTTCHSTRYICLLTRLHNKPGWP